jgi:fatty acid-binding protein DegV
MRRQSQARSAQRRHVVVVTDSGADLPESIFDEFDIHTVPLRIHFADRTLLDKVGMAPAEFMRELATSAHHPQTRSWRRATCAASTTFWPVTTIRHCHQPARRVSGTSQASRMAGLRSSSPERITVIDSQSVSVARA